VDAEQTPAEGDPLVGKVIGERYKVLAPLGRGGMGAVYRVEHVMMKKELALKLLHPELGRMEEVAKRFEREAEAAARLDHPNIITVTDFGRTGEGQLFLVMELLNGPSLAEVIRPHDEGRPLGNERAVHVIRQVLRALEHAHEAGIVHRDLKPENIVLIERDDQKDIVKLLDFGIAKISEGDSKRETLTQAGVVFGTPEYLSPEQAMGEQADGRADLYAGGVMLYEMLTGKRPFEAQSKVEVLSMHLTRDAQPMNKVAPDANIPQSLERVVEKAMAKKREERFATAASFLKALDQGVPTGALPRRSRSSVMTSLAKTWPFLVQRAREAGVPWPRAFIGGALGLVVALVLLFVVAHRSEKPRPVPQAIATDVKNAELLLARGDREGARLSLQQLLAAHPESARVRYLFGNLDYADGERLRALGDYRDAIRLDAGYKNDPVLRANLRATLDRKNEAMDALQLLVEDVGTAGLGDIVNCAKTCKDDKVRKKAAESAVKLGGPQLLAEEGKPADAMEETLDRLEKGRSCRDRKSAAMELIKANDAKYLDALRDARDRRGGFLGLQQINICMRKELDSAIRKLEAEK
jgi:tRNA A-37 threonylcarbamoyl transferase component Bud32/tetratricopeptide (TPR) repeat protein